MRSVFHPQSCRHLLVHLSAISRGILLVAPLWLAACAAVPPSGMPMVDALQRPAERQLAAGLRAYEDARYGDAEAALADALRLGLSHARDQAAAHKTLAFIYCTSQRSAQCAAAFRAASAADPGFALNRAEAGHPQWGPVYQATRR
jgi:Tfp pilus assembly protein PilF